MLKRFVTALLCVTVLFGLLLPAAGATDVSAMTHSFIISIYNDLTRQYAVENQSLTVTGEKTVSRSVEALMDNGFISGFQHDGSRLSQITYKDEAKKTVTLANSGGNTFYVKVNGAVLPDADLTQYVVDGDIIEWIYGVAPEAASHEMSSHTEDSSSSEPEPLPAEIWDDAAARALDDACEWLNQNTDASTFYLVAIGSAGKSADVKMVNNLLTEVKQTKEYSSPTEIARNVLKLSFCGFDTSNADNAALITQLSAYPDIMSQGVFGAINALVALDSRGYTVPASAVNNRDDLVGQLLTYQKESGGFSIMPESEADIDTTAMAITALSAYRSQEKVAAAIDAAVDFLEDNQTASGGFGYQGQENCESLAQVVIAFSSIGIKLDDARFVRGEKTLLDQLLDYRMPDGGFSHLKEDTQSSAMPTEQAVIALSSAKKNGNPYRVSTSLKNTVTPSAQTPLSELKDDMTAYFVVAGVLIALVAIAVGVAIWLKKSRHGSSSDE